MQCILLKFFSYNTVSIITNNTFKMENILLSITWKLGRPMKLYIYKKKTWLDSTKNLLINVELKKVAQNSILNEIKIFNLKSTRRLIHPFHPRFFLQNFYQ